MILERWVMESLAGLKTISMVFLVVALAGASPVFAQDELVVTLTPAAGCPGTEVLVYVEGLVSAQIQQLSDGPVLIWVISSDPDGLIADQECQQIPSDDALPISRFLVGESASCGRYNVTLAVRVNVPPSELCRTLATKHRTFTVPG